MEIYHEVWLSAHPGRTKDWLLEKLKDGFDIHHLDGNHDNNAAENLILVEGSDHFRLHSGVVTPRELSSIVAKRLTEKRTEIYGKALYQADKEQSFKDHCKALDISKPTGKKYLTLYCEANGFDVPSYAVPKATEKLIEIPVVEEGPRRIIKSKTLANGRRIFYR